jgi:acid ceramidase
MQNLTIDLRDPPQHRWRLSPSQQRQARELLSLYKADLGISLDLNAREQIHPDHWAELESLAQILGVPIADAVLCNLYYDALKLVLGCTAFAVDTPGGVLHARNLDWWTQSAILSRYTIACRFIGGPAGEFTTIGWPGFLGAFSGIAPGRFAVTLNAVLSQEPAIRATPVVLVLRTVLEQARSFAEALNILSTTPLPSDSLLLLTGIHKGEHAVIERTPTRSAVRRGQHGFTCVTNDYRELPSSSNQPTTEILATSCHRFNRTESLLATALPINATTCFDYLSNAEVRMGITVQQMVFQPATGQFWVQIP